MLFYPSHDIALAHGVRHFNPPAAALRLQEDLASLSHIWNQPFEAGLSSMPLPWGWDWDTRQHLHKQHGIKLSQLPTDEELELIRQLSSRRTTITLIQRLNEVLPQQLSEVLPQQLSEQLCKGQKAPLFTPFRTPLFLQTMAEVEAFIDQHEHQGRPFVLKTPWSSSGRGLMRSGIAREALLRHARATLQRMGGIMGEEWMEGKVQDFAMLFYVSDHDVRMIGYSLFDNDGTTYRQGYLLSNEEIERRLSIDPTLLHALSQSYEQILTSLFQPFFGRPWQLGYVGIDMMTLNPPPCDGHLPIVPCVEMNLRCTMGVVCRLWYDEHQQPGIFRITPMSEEGHFRAEFVTQM